MERGVTVGSVSLHMGHPHLEDGLPHGQPPFLKRTGVGVRGDATQAHDFVGRVDHAPSTRTPAVNLPLGLELPRWKR